MQLVLDKGKQHGLPFPRSSCKAPSKDDAHHGCESSQPSNFIHAIQYTLIFGHMHYYCTFSSIHGEKCPFEAIQCTCQHPSSSPCCIPSRWTWRNAPRNSQPSLSMNTFILCIYSVHPTSTKYIHMNDIYIYIYTYIKYAPSAKYRCTWLHILYMWHTYMFYDEYLIIYQACLTCVQWMGRKTDK